MCKALEDRAAESEEKGILNTLADLVRKGLITTSQAAEQAKMSVEEFKKSRSDRRIKNQKITAKAGRYDKRLYLSALCFKKEDLIE